MVDDDCRAHEAIELVRSVREHGVSMRRNGISLHSTVIVGVSMQREILDSIISSSPL